MKTAVRLIALLSALTVHSARADDLFANRPAFSRAEEPAASSARCDQIRAMAEGLDAPDFRIDLSVEGQLTAVQSDGVLWYLIACNLPDVRVMCVTYQRNDMKAGDNVVFKGAYRRIDTHHVVLDPCLADRSDTNPADSAPAK